ncbi:AMP-binding protein [Amycolatopsis sp. FDAARGOS 1241]|uniref:AMP-binding protein n=1 Tax=Amycolatopsis sp. FDAARGOS 1241 TaxID=2778070 RepID=UPI00194F1DA1|nr:AMP-binding protein [Amycolatopsis sp. FDAARGOS 1241]QRP43691.1 AMP-binding protein [Amycolatopsis sp. FDAARGOS 1241]
MADSVEQLISVPVQELPERWRSPGRAAEIARARAMHDRDPDEYWAWVAGRQRWIRPWDEVRSGNLPNFRYFTGGLINVADNCVDRWAEDPATADRPAVVWEGEPGDTRTVTYAKLARESSSLAAGLLALGVGKGDVVAIYLPNLVEAFTAIHACNRIGAIYTVLFSGFGKDAVAARLKVSGAKAVVVADASYRRGKLVPLLDTLRAARAGLPSLERVVVLDRTGRDVELESGEVRYADLVARHPEGTPAVPLEANDPAFLIFTSGTESTPKGVVHSVAGFLVGTWANAYWQAGLEEGDVYWVAADVGWLTFPIQAVIGGLACGTTIACYEGALDTPTNARFYEFCERHEVTKVLAAPTVLRMLRSFGEELRAAHPLPRLQLVTVQGEPLDADTFTWGLTRLGVPIVNAYGQTETGSTWTYPVTGVDALKAGSAGRPLPGHGCEVVDDDGVPVPAGTKGNLVITRPFPTLARTVWHDHERYLSAYFTRYPGKYCTNDEAVLDADGHLWVLGRADDVINVAAHRISTMEIEGVVTADDRVAEAAVVGVPDATKGTVPVAFVTLLPGADARTVADDLIHRVGAELGGYARLARVYPVTALPKTRTGKTMRRLLRDVLVEGGPSGDTSAMEDPGALDAVLAAVSAG